MKSPTGLIAQASKKCIYGSENLGYVNLWLVHILDLIYYLILNTIYYGEKYKIFSKLFYKVTSLVALLFINIYLCVLQHV